jgi:hydrogenase/urease accessory protein HupE
MLLMIIPSVADVVLASVICLGLVVMMIDIASKKKQKTA